MQSLLILLPCFAGFFWLVMYSVMAPSIKPYKHLRLFFLVWFLLFFFAVTPIVDREKSPIVLFTILEEFLGTLVIPVSMIYLYAIRKDSARRPDLFFGLCLMFPIVILVSSTVAAYIAGVADSREMILAFDSGKSLFSYDQKESFVLMLSISAYKILLIAEFLVLATVVMVESRKRHYKLRAVMAFFFKHGKANLESVQFVLLTATFFLLSGMMVLGKSYSYDRPWLLIVCCVVLTFLISLFGYTASVGCDHEVTMDSIFSQYRFSRHDEMPAQPVLQAPAVIAAAQPDAVRKPAVPEADVLQHAESIRKSSVYQDNPQPVAPTSAPLTVPEKDRLKDCFEQTVIYERLFLQAKISIAAVAQMLGVDKNELSDYISQTYGMNFLNYINMLRIDYAEQYILNHKDATQKQIAMSCGFASASAFNLAFSKITGVTPKIWLDRYVELTQRNDTMI